MSTPYRRLPVAERITVVDQGEGTFALMLYGRIAWIGRGRAYATLCRNAWLRGHGAALRGDPLPRRLLRTNFQARAYALMCEGYHEGAAERELRGGM